MEKVSQVDEPRSVGRRGRCRCLGPCRIEIGVPQTFFSTSAEFFEPNPTQLQIACSIWPLRPASGT